MTTSAAASSPSPAILSPAELLFGDFGPEWASTRRMLERYPAGKGDWRPHERSKSLCELATHVADIVNRGNAILETDGMEVGVRPPMQPLNSPTELLAHLEQGLARFNGLLAAIDYDRLAEPWTISNGGRVIFQAPRRVMLRTIMMSHLIHHRAQLGVYYRLLGVPVPGMYGPTADD